MIDITEGEIYCFKLNNGEEVVSKVEAVEDKHFGLNKPLSVGITPEGPHMVPTIMTGNAQELFWLSKSSCAIVCTPGSDINAEYTKLTTGLEVPKEKKILRG